MHFSYASESNHMQGQVCFKLQIKEQQPRAKKNKLVKNIFSRIDTLLRLENKICIPKLLF